jgi:hypothetical protein
VNVTPHSIANPCPKLTKKSTQGVCPIIQEPVLAPTIAVGIAIIAYQ